MALDLTISEKDLPMLSVVATQAMDLLNQSTTVTNQQLNELIRQDPALASRVLHIANSPFYGGRLQVRSISDALVRMGLRQVRNILVMAAAGELFDASDPVIHSLWDHSMAVAAVSDRLAGKLQLPETQEIFIAGLLHDIGKFVIYYQHPEPYKTLMQESTATGVPLIQLEDARFQYFNHVSTGGIAIHKWKLPDAVAEAARFHHGAETELFPNLKNRNMVCLVSLANIFVCNHGLGLAVHPPETVSHLACVKHLRLTDEKIGILFKSVEDLCHVEEKESMAGNG